MDATPHDFTKPTPLATDWQARLLTWHKMALVSANKAWSKQLGVPLEASIINLDIAYARTELAQLTEQSLTYRVKIGERLDSLLVMPRLLALNLVGVLLGETTAATERELTLIEDKLADYFLTDQWLTFFRDTWPGAQPVSWVLQERDGKQKRYSDDEVLLVAHWRLRGAWGDADGVWCFPKKPLLESLTGQNAAAELPEAQVVARRETLVQRLPLEVQIVLGAAELPLAELSSLTVGDVVLLDQRVDQGVTARVGGMDYLRGHVGRVGSTKAFRIESIVKK